MSVTASCPHCAAPVCPEHRAPAAHDCPGVDADRTGGWIVDLDAPRSRSERSPEHDRTTGTRRPFTRPSRSGAWLAVATLAVVLAAVLAVAVGPSTDAPGGAVVASADEGGLNETRVGRLVAERTNAERRARGLDPLAYDRTLARVGTAHATDMRERGFVGHENPDGEGLRERYAAFGLECPGGENVYHAPNGGLARSAAALAEHVVDAWMDSAGHRGAILEARFTRQGIGVVLGPDGGVWVAQEFC